MPASDDALTVARPRLRRALGRWDLTAIGVNQVIGGAIFLIPALVAAQLGGWSPIGFALAGLASMLRAGGRLILDLPLYEIGREPEHWTDQSVWTRAEIEMLAPGLGLEILSAWVSPGEFDRTTLGSNHGKVVVLRKC